VVDETVLFWFPLSLFILGLDPPGLGDIETALIPTVAMGLRLVFAFKGGTISPIPRRLSYRPVLASGASLSCKLVSTLSGAGPALSRASTLRTAVLLKIYIYGYLNRIQSSRRLERETQRNVELMWLTERLAPDFKTIADFRHDIPVPIEQFEVLVNQG
jgi:hypothetical protein